MNTLLCNHRNRLSTFFVFFFRVCLEVFVSVWISESFWFESAEFSFVFIVIT